MQTVNLNGRYGLPGRTKASAAISIGNSSPEPGVAAGDRQYGARGSPTLERSTAEAEARTLSMVYTVNSRPSRVSLAEREVPLLRLRHPDPGRSSSRRWSSPTTRSAPRRRREPLDIKRQTLDLDASYTPFQFASLNFGYSARRCRPHLPDLREDRGQHPPRLDRQHRQPVLHGSGGHREILPHGLGRRLRDAGGDRRTDRDAAFRHRQPRPHPQQPDPDSDADGGARLQRASVATGHDDYSESYFGLRDNKNNSYSLGFDLVPQDTVNFGVEYVHEKYTAPSNGRARRIRCRARRSTIRPATGASIRATKSTRSRRTWTSSRRCRRPTSASGSISAMASRPTSTTWGPTRRSSPASTTDREMCSTRSRSCRWRPTGRMTHRPRRPAVLRSRERRARRRLLVRTVSRARTSR